MSLDIKAPIGPFDHIEKFGHPWHGLVKNGILALSGGRFVPYPQPSGEHEYAGMTRSFSCGMPPAVTTPAEAADGQEWRNVATLSGADCQLYSRGIGAGAWLYCDPDGVRWRVTTTAEGRTPAQIEAGFVVRLMRFGELGGVPEVHTYSVTDAALGQSEPAFDSEPNLAIEPIARCIDSHPDKGRAAIYSLDIKRFAMECSQPVGFFEVRLAGPGAACDVAFVLLNSRASALGTVTGSVPEVPNTYTWTVLETTYAGEQQGYPTCSGSRTRTDTPVLTTVWPSNVAGRIETPFVGDIDIAVDSAILARYYKPDGTIGSITYSEHYLGSIDCPAATLTDVTPGVTVTTYNGQSGGNCSATIEKVSELAYTLTETGQVSERFSMEISVDGVLHASVVLTSEYANTETRSNTAELTTKSVSVTQTPGGTSTHDAQVSYQPAAHFGPPLLFNLSRYLVLSVPELRVHFPGMSGTRGPWVVEDGKDGGLQVTPCRLAPLLWGFAFEQTPDRAVWDTFSGTEFASPYGPHTLDVVAHPQLRTAELGKVLSFYGSVCPVTGAVAVDIEPVSFV